MQEKQWQQALIGLILLGTFAFPVFAQPGATPKADRSSPSTRTSRARPNRGGGFVARLDQAVGLTTEQREAVLGLMAEQREESRALREKTDSKIRALLNSDQQKKFDALVAELKASFRQRGA